MVLFNLEEEQIKEIFDKYGEHPKECAFVPHLTLVSHHISAAFLTGPFPAVETNKQNAPHS